MNATKRKFNTLLNNFGNKSTTSLSTKESGNTPQSPPGEDGTPKKQRTSVDVTPRRIPASRLNALTISSHKKPASLPATETPKYAPWDRVEFLKRLKSFSNITDWTPKPARVNEVEWAKRGWVCQKSERVRCCLCNVEILVKLNKKEIDGQEEPVYVAQNIEDALVDRYVELIITSHDENCLWRKRGCDDTIFKLPLAQTDTTIQGLRERYDELQTRAGTLPYQFNMKLPDGFDLDLAIKYMPEDFFRPVPLQSMAAPRTDINRVAFMMALFGWQGHSHVRLGDQVGSVSCQACFRVLGLWLFKSKEVNEASEEIAGAVVDGLDVVLQHREYCPWRSAESQNGVKSTVNAKVRPLAGWEIVLRLLKNGYRLRTGKDIGNVASRSSVSNDNPDGATDDDDAMSSRDAKDKERWARLRRVKSLFDTKGAKKEKDKQNRNSMKAA